MRRTWLGASGLVAFCLLCAASARAQSSTGYELALSGGTVAVHGEVLRVSGTAFDVIGLAGLRPLAGADITAAIEIPRDGRWVPVARHASTSAASGRFQVELLVPMTPMQSPRVAVTVVKGGGTPRTFAYPLEQRSPHALQLLTDRARYEPGETMHVFTRGYVLRSGAPLRDQALRIVVRDPRGRVIADEHVRTRTSGSIATDIVFPSSAEDGAYNVAVALEDAPIAASTSRTVHVARRTTERLIVSVTLAAEIVAPGGTIRGRVVVRTPSGAPVRGAEARIRVQRGEEIVLTSDEDGQVDFAMPAPMFLSGGFETQTIGVRITHPAHGTLHASAAYTLARTEWRVSVMADTRLVVPELPSVVYLEVTDLRGRPAPAGTRVDVSGPGVPPGTSATLDADGFAEVPMLLPLGAAGPIPSTRTCTGAAGVVLVVDVRGRTTDRTEVCVGVDRHALVRPHVERAVVTPEQAIVVSVTRRREAERRPVLLELLDGNVLIASALVEGNATRGQITVPTGTQGFFVVRARPLGDAGVTPPVDREGDVMFGTGAAEGVLVRPSDAFGLAIEGRAEPYAVRSTARLALTRTRGNGEAYVTLVARDLAQHGGEEDYAARFAERFRAEIAAADREDSRLVRATLAAALPLEQRARGVAPIVVSPWDRDTRYRSSVGVDGTRGELRDPLRVRDMLLRHRVGQIETVLERALAQETESEQRVASGEAALVVRRDRIITGFDPRALEALVARRMVATDAVTTLGGGRMTLAMIEQADPAFRFEHVAARIARNRLVRLMVAVVRFSSPDDERAARAAAGLPPERWLSRMIEIHMLPPAALLDPWGRPFAFRSVASGGPRYRLSDRAPQHELVSAGADGRFGTSDDVRDPFARVVPEGTPYAVASGEDNLMRALAALAPGESTLRSMLSAYDTLSLSAREEARGPRVSASTGEMDVNEAELAEPSPADAEGDIDALASRALRGGNARMAQEAQAQPMAPPAITSATTSEVTLEREREDPHGAQEPDAPEESLARAGELVRERFPATLFFLGELALDGPVAHVDIPLADALTTYRVEAIAWSSTGWVTSARTEIRSDQDATVDAPVPPFVTVGDEIRVPIRIANRTAAPLDARVELSSETNAITVSGIHEARVPPHDAVVVVVTARATSEGEGALVARAVRASDGSPLDAARRPIRVLPDARLVRRTERRLLEGPGPIEIDVPQDATPRGPAELRIATGFDFFGELPRDTPKNRLAYAYLLAFAGLPEDAALTAEIASLLRFRPDGTGETPTEPALRNAAYAMWHRDTLDLAQAVGAAARSRSIPDDSIVDALDRLSDMLPETSDRGDASPSAYVMDAETLLMLAPALESGRDGEASASITRTVRRLRDLVANAAARVSSNAYVETCLATALAVTARAEGLEIDPRAAEVLRRIDGDIVRVGDMAFIEEQSQYGFVQARVRPTALLAIARLALGDRPGAFASLRALAHVHRTEGAGRFLAALALAKLTPGIDRPVSLVIDGAPGPALERRNGVATATLPELGRPGAHTIEARLPENGFAWVEIDVRYGRPWNAREARALAVDVTVDGPVGARDTRSGLAVSLRNRSPRTLRRPVLEIDLPAGVELDEPTRVAIARFAAGQPTVESRTLRIPLRPLVPGGTMRIPLPMRFSVAGELRGLGASLHDDVASYDEGRAFAVLPSRSLAIADEGQEPAQAEAEATTTPEAPPPRPMPLLRPLSP